MGQRRALDDTFDRSTPLPRPARRAARTPTADIPFIHHHHRGGPAGAAAGARSRRYGDALDAIRPLLGAQPLCLGAVRLGCLAGRTDVETVDVRPVGFKVGDATAAELTLEDARVV